MRLFFTTRRLIKQAELSKNHICTDATYKLIWQGYPVLIVGTTDKDKKFHPYGLAVCINEETDDFAFIFESLKVAINKISGFDYKPTTLVADASGAITAGFIKVFGSVEKRVNCWAHMLAKK